MCKHSLARACALFFITDISFTDSIVQDCHEYRSHYILVQVRTAPRIRSTIVGREMSQTVINLKIEKIEEFAGRNYGACPTLTHAAGHAARCITRSPHPRSAPRPSSPALSRRYPALSRSLSRTTTCTSFITGKRNSASRSGGDARQHAGARRVLSPHDVGAGTSVHQKRRPLRVAVAQARSGDERSHRRAARSVR